MRLALQYQPDHDQMELAGEFETPLSKLLPIARLHGPGSGEDAATWQQLADLGLLAAALDETHGGSGLGATELSLIGLELARGLASPAVFATIAAFESASRLAPDILPRVAAAFPVGDSIWIDEPGANFLLVRRENDAALYAVPVSAAIADEDLWGVRLSSGAIGPMLQQLSPRESQLARLLDAAALAGIARATLEMAVDYAGKREQFGRPIGSFQAIKHHCATMAIAARSACDLTTFAAVAIDGGRDDAMRCVESAFLVAARAAIDNAGTNVQIHGGIGFSAEADPHLFVKRARLLAALGGGTDAAALRIATSPTSQRWDM